MTTELSGISAVNIFVNEYEEAIAFYRDVLGFILDADITVSENHRWVKFNVGAGGAGIFLTKADTIEQKALVGRQAGDQVLMILETKAFDQSYLRLTQQGVVFIEEPRNEPYGKVAIFEDIYGNKWDLIQPI